MKCPNCGSMNCTKSGKKVVRGGSVQAVTCKDCGYRGTLDRFTPPLPSREEVKAALGGIEPPWLPGCSIPNRESDGGS